MKWGNADEPRAGRHGPDQARNRKKKHQNESSQFFSLVKSSLGAAERGSLARDCAAVSWRLQARARKLPKKQTKIQWDELCKRRKKRYHVHMIE